MHAYIHIQENIRGDSTLSKPEAHTSTHAFIYAHILPHIHADTHIQTHINADTHTYKHTYTHMLAYKHSLTRNFVDGARGAVNRQSSGEARGIYIHTYNHIYTQIHTHTNTHTRTCNHTNTHKQEISWTAPMALLTDNPLAKPEAHTTTHACTYANIRTHI